MIEATCHCGAVRFEVARAPDTVTSCNCSICRRLGSVCAYYPAAEVTLTTPRETIAEYVWGDKMIAFGHCRVCGCATGWRPMPGYDEGRVAINARLFPPEVLAAARVRRIDGADTWKYLDE